MIYRIKQNLKKRWFNFKCREILSTPPLEFKGADLTIISMVSHMDMIMYLISIKSFYYRLKQGKIIILDDGTLTANDRKLLREHIPFCEIVPASRVNTHKCPGDVSWKRLLFVVDIVKDSYVIQLDSDLLTLDDVSEVAQCVQDNRSFIIGTWKNQEIESMKERCEKARKINSMHVQILAESNFDKLVDCNRLRYVRGCSGFCGFAKGSFSRFIVEDFSEQMQKLIGSTWLKWGSEQTTTNYIVANSPNPMVLPYPKYKGFKPWQQDKASLIHFIGMHRFEKGVYAKLSSNVIKEMNKK